MQSTNSAPVIFRVVKHLQKRRIRGAFRLESLARNSGLLDVVVRYDIDQDVKLDVPIAKRSYDRDSIFAYERQVLALLTERAARCRGPINLIDCGADIGLMSVRLVAAIPRISRVIAFEPNPEIFSYLKLNIERLPVEAEAISAAVADFVGEGILRFPDHDQSDQAAFLVPVSEGPVRVMTIDDLDLASGESLLLKIDVEGGELAVVNGAIQSLKRATDFAVVFEAHRNQVRRSGIDTSEIVATIAGIKPVRVVVVEEPEFNVDWDRPFFDQVDGAVYNVCVSTL